MCRNERITWVLWRILVLAGSRTFRTNGRISDIAPGRTKWLLCAQGHDLTGRLCSSSFSPRYRGLSSHLRWVRGSEDHAWIGAKAGDYIHVPSNARHALCNLSGTLTVVLIITTKKIGQFFQETGRPVTESPQPVTSEDLARFAAISAKYGYWNASPAENALVGIHLSF
jgi:hypothetical protein